MPSVPYGKKIIDFSIHEKAGLKSYYISVERDKGVVLKGSRLPLARAEKLILKKAKWIIDKLERVRPVKEDVIISGSRIPYLGKQYYADVKFSKSVEQATVVFNHSSFKIVVNPDVRTQAAIRHELDQFYKAKAIEKISPRVSKLSKQTGLTFNKLKFVKMGKRWGSCTPENNIIINTEAVKLPFTLIDYLIVHELSHTKVKDHSRWFYRELARHMGNWREMDERMSNGVGY